MPTTSDFKLKPDSGLELSHISYDVSSQIDEHGQNLDLPAQYFAVCNKVEGDGLSGVVVHGTLEFEGEDTFREQFELSPPNDDGVTITHVRFLGVEGVHGRNVRIVGYYTAEETGELRRGFFYEGSADGNGDWYPIEIPASEETIALRSYGDILVCDSDDGSDKLWVFWLNECEWFSYHRGYALSFEIDDVYAKLEGFYIKGTHSNGKEFEVFHGRR